MERKNYVYQNSNQQQNSGQYYGNPNEQIQPKRTLMSYVPQRRTPAIISPPRQYNRQNSIQASSYASPGPPGHVQTGHSGGQSHHVTNVTQSPQLQPMSQPPQQQSASHGSRQHGQMVQRQSHVVLSTPQGLSGRIIQERGINFLETQDGQRIELRASGQQQIQVANQIPGNQRPSPQLNQYSFSESKQFVQQQPQPQPARNQYQQQNVQKHYFPIGLPQAQSVQSIQPQSSNQIQQNQSHVQVQYRKVNQQPRMTNQIQVPRGVVYQSNAHLGNSIQGSSSVHEQPRVAPKPSNRQDQSHGTGKIYLPNFVKKIPKKHPNQHPPANPSRAKKLKSAPQIMVIEKPKPIISYERDPPREDDTPIEEMDFTKKVQTTLDSLKADEDADDKIPVIELKPMNQPFEVTKLAVFSSKFYKPYQWAENVELEELQKALELPLSRKEFDSKQYFHDILNNVHRHKNQVWQNGVKKYGDENLFNFRFEKSKDLQLWRCHSKIFTMDTDLDTLKITVSMCNSVTRNRWDDMGDTRRKNQYFKQKAEKIKSEEAASNLPEPEVLDPEDDSEGGGGSVLDLISKEMSKAVDEEKKKKMKQEAEEKMKTEVEDKTNFKLSANQKQTAIQDHPCLFYTWRLHKKNGCQTRGFPVTHLCKVCEDILTKDIEDLEERNWKGATKYYDSSGSFTKEAKYIRHIQCGFQGLRKLTIQKWRKRILDDHFGSERPLNSEDSIHKCFKERRALKVSSFTNAKLCPEWYYKLFIPTDTLDEVKMNTACAELMLGLLWPDIREMLLTEMNFEEKYVRESVTEQIAKLKVRYGKNNIKRVIPGVREMCDDCQTSIFNYHFICLFCGHITCITCGEKHFTFKSMTGVSTKTKRNISCKSCSETERFRKSDEKPRDCMLPISLIPIDAIHHLYEILKHVMKDYPENSIPDRKHHHSLQKYFQSKRLIPDSLEWNQLNTKQQDELILRDKKDRIKKADKKIVSILDELFDGDDDDPDYDSTTKMSPSGNNNLKRDYDTEKKPKFEQVVKIKSTPAPSRSERHFRDVESSCIYIDGSLPQAQVDNEVFYAWAATEPSVVYNLNKHSNFNSDIWTINHFKKHFSYEKSTLIDCRNNEMTSKRPLGDFWAGFEDYEQRFEDDELPSIYKLKDWPTTDDIKNKMPRHYSCFKNILPAKDMVSREGALNLARYLPKYFCIPDLGPKMYIAYGWLEEFIGTNRKELYEKMRQGSTDAHVDISGAFNVLANVVEPKAPSSLFTRRQRKDALRAILHEGSVDDDVIEKFIQSGMVAGALWHMWAPKFTPKIRQILKDLDKENYKKSSGNDPIHDQDTYITKELRAKLEEKDIYAETIIQCEGDGVFIPQGAIHQVLNINSCVKIAVDFISCQCVRNALETTNELRGLSSTHENREDKLQLKSHIYHTAKEIANGIIYQPFLKHSPVPQETDE